MFIQVLCVLSFHFMVVNVVYYLRLTRHLRTQPPALQVNCVINLLLYPKVPQASVRFTYETSGPCCIPDRRLKINNTTRACQHLVWTGRASTARCRLEYCAQIPTLDVVMFDTEFAEFLVRCAYVFPFGSAVNSARMHSERRLNSDIRYTWREIPTPRNDGWPEALEQQHAHASRAALETRQ